MQMTPIIQSITSYYHIPLILINWQPNAHHSDTSFYSRRRRSQLGANDIDAVPRLHNYTINLYPQADQLSQAYLDLIRYKGWKSFTLIYDTAEDFVLVKDILETSFSDTNINIQRVSLPADYSEALMDYDNTPPTVPKRIESLNEKKVGRADYCSLDDSRGSSLGYGKLMKDLRKRGVENLVLSMPLEKVCWILREASNVQLLTIYNDYVIANLDIHLLNLTQLQPLMTNISGYSLLDPEGQQTDFKLPKNWLNKKIAKVPKKLLSTEYCLMSDAISLVATSLSELIYDSSYGKNVIGPTTDCESSKVWTHGDAMMKLLKSSIKSGGYTGDLKFDKFGQRADFSLEYILHRNNTFKKVGSWDSTERLSDNLKQSDDFGFEVIMNKTLKVTVAITPPYVKLRENYKEYTGNDRYEGYCIDLMNKLAKKLQFKYVIKEVADGQYGKIQNGSWTGMIKELLDWQADLAIVDLTITKERQSAVDFTHPFMTLGIAIMYKKPKLEEAELYSFLMPLSKEVWLSMWSAYVGISLALWVVSRLSPLEWKNPHPCFDNPDERDLENEIHSIGASLWFTIGSLMQQGSDLAPRSPSVRALASVWYFFTLILISSYTANFAAFLTASRMQSPIESAEDLSKQTRIDYGCKEGGSTQAFFATSNHSTYRRMWNFMESRKHQGVFPNNNELGISRVKKGNFAFLMESTSIDYEVQKDCELTQIGGLLDHKGYGIALRKRSPYRAPLSKWIVELNEAGELSDLKSRWWDSGGAACEEQKDSASATSELGIDKVGGVFLMLGVGVTIASVAAILEFVWKSMKISRTERVSTS